MSETCCYCGETLLSCPWHIPDRELLERGYHYWCHQTRQEPGMLRAQLAALAAAHDAAMAEADREIESGKDLERGVEILIRTARVHEERADVALRQALLELHTMELARAEQVARADAAEAQLATAREDGARSMAALIAENMECYERGYDDTYDLRDRVELAFYRADGTDYVKVQDTDAVLAAWQAHETEATG